MFVRLNSGALLTLIGDPHFGRKFVNGVPLNRRGDREESQKELFKNLMFNLDLGEDVPTQVSAVVMMGDLFDGFHVDNDTLVEVYTIIAQAANRAPDVPFFMIQGNHDITRNAELKSSFDVLERMLIHKENVIFVKEPTRYYLKNTNDLLLFFPYDAFAKQADLAREEIALGGADKVAAAFGHWDIEDFGKDDNLIPLKELAPVCDYIFTGHVHTPKMWVVNQQGLPPVGGELEKLCTVNVVGSMQPYTHGEDPTGVMYRTLTLAEVNKAIEAEPDVFHNVCLRVVLKKDEELPENLDVLQLAVKYVDDENQEENEVKMEIFSFKALFDQCMIENNVPADTIKVVWGRYQEKNKDAQDS